MPVKWNKTKFPGVRYYEHATRKHGISYDKYYAIRYQHSGRIVEEGIGWASQGHDADEANTIRARLKQAAKNNTGSASLTEEREAEKSRQNEATRLDELQRSEEARRNITFGEFFRSVYLPQVKVDKAPATAANEELAFRNWIAPVLDKLRFDEISIDHLDKIKRNMLAGKRPPAKKHGRDRKPKAKDAHLRRNKAKPMAPRSIMYALAVIRQTWNRACASNPPLAFGAWPGASKAFKKPKVDNHRRRFLTRNEAALILETLKVKSTDTHDMALLALHCGMRAGEVFNLTWDKVNLPKGEIYLVDTKNGETRTAYLTDEALAVLRQRSMNCKHQRIVFPTKNKTGETVKHQQVPATFGKTVAELGLNEGVNDPRDRIVFHSLRHTYASWLVEHGASLPIVRDLLGHKNLIMTSRYSHVSAEAQRDAVRALNRSLTPSGDNIIHLNQRRNEEGSP